MRPLQTERLGTNHDAKCYVQDVMGATEAHRATGFDLALLLRDSVKVFFF